MSPNAATWILLAEVNHRQAEYAAALDERRFSDWAGFFTSDARYSVQARENFDRGLPLCLIDLESQAMMQDRVYGVTQTIYHIPYYTRHVIGQARWLGPSLQTGSESESGVVRFKTDTNYAVFRTKPADATEVFNVGRYLDEWVRVDGELLLSARRCVYDSEMVLNSLIYPI